MLSRSARPSEAITIPVAPLRRVGGLVIALFIIVVLLLLFVSQRDRVRVLLGGTEAAYIDGSTYQSVVLTTNQAYFGKLRIDGDVYLLTDVYALSAGGGDQSASPLQLVKRGGELNGPADPLVIPGRSVLFFENMRQDAPVMNAIRQLKSGQGSPIVPATATPARTPAPSASR